MLYSDMQEHFSGVHHNFCNRLRTNYKYVSLLSLNVAELPFFLRFTFGNVYVFQI